MVLGLVAAALTAAAVPSAFAAKPTSKPKPKPASPATKGSKGVEAIKETTAAERAADSEKEAAQKRRPMVSKPTDAEIAAIKAEGKKIAVIETAKGIVLIELFDDDAPLSVANFVKLARAGFYDGLTFHRVLKEPKPFVVQGGDPLGNGMGGPGYTITGEFSQTRLHAEGTVAMARSGDPNSAGSQFYIALAPAPHLDGKYAIFGQVIGGIDFVNAIVQGDIMNRVSIEAAKP